jgi:DNA-binding LytR/AlgR family response regulator
MRVLIVEDETAAASRLRKMVAEVAPDAQILEVTDSISSTVKWLKGNPAPDLILLDIHLADGPSFKIFEEIEVSTPVIFTTAFDQYAIQAFKVNSIDYLLKPIKREELEHSFAKYRGLFGGKILPNYNELLKALAEQAKPQTRQRFLVNYADKLRAIEVPEIAYFMAHEKGVFLTTLEGKNYAIDITLEKLENELDSLSFFRINRKFIICIKAIAAMHTYSKSRVKLDLKPDAKTEVIVSSDRAGEFKRWLDR